MILLIAYFFLFPSQGLSTYKELCSLASDLSQPDLVYKFMNLANHHAMWNSRKVSCSHWKHYIFDFSAKSNMPRGQEVAVGMQHAL